jgi:hypothetical protein
MTLNSERVVELREPALAGSSLMQRMDDQHMSDNDRQAAAEWLRDGEALADFICRTTDALRSTAAFLEHSFPQRSR